MMTVTVKINYENDEFISKKEMTSFLLKTNKKYISICKTSNNGIKLIFFVDILKNDDNTISLIDSYIPSISYKIEDFFF